MENSTERKSYGFVVYPGNNPTVIEQALKKRGNWHSIPHDKDILAACLLWKNLNFVPRVLNEFEELLKFSPSRTVLLP
jgi:hypothetical protein